VWQPVEGPQLVTDLQHPLLDDNCMVEFLDIGLTVKMWPRRISWGDAGGGTIGVITEPIEFGSFNNISMLKFHICNFPRVIGRTVRYDAILSRSRMEWRSESWSVVIDPVEHLVEIRSSFENQLSDERGHAITHVGLLTRIDGAAMNFDETLAVLRDIASTLSFARGAFTTPMLMEAYDSSGLRVWQCWSACRSDAWRAHETWFSKQKPLILESVFSGWRRLSNEATFEIIRAAAHMFLDSHTPRLALESKLVLLQAALEGLAHVWPYPPLPNASQVPPMKSGAAKRIAAIPVSLGLRLDADPAILPELAALPSPTSSAPMLEKVAWVRNSISHLNNWNRMAPYDWKLRREAKQVAAMHLELALLRLLDASGEYLNRLNADHHGQVAGLPWK
jgi:hypothetical protein